MKKNSKLIVSLVLVLAMLIPLYVYGKEDYKMLTAQNSLPVGKEFVIQFDQPLNKRYINTTNVYVLNSKSQRVAVAPSLSGDGKAIIVKPVKPYASDSKYTLYIRKYIRYANGKELGKSMKMSFSTAAYKGGLPVVASKEKLIQILENNQKQYETMWSRGMGLAVVPTLEGARPEAAAAPQDASAPPSAPTASKNSASPDYSSTNIQVQGVDEADIVKTDGQYIYQVARDKVVISNAYPADKMTVVDSLEYQGTMQPLELYVDAKHMVVIGAPSWDSGYNKRIMPYYHNNSVIMKIYDIADKSNVKEIREIQLEGSYLSSRKIGTEVYLITNKYMNYYMLQPESGQEVVPMYKDTLQGKDFVKVGYDKIRYFPDSVDSNYMIVAGLSLNTPNEKLNVDTYLGASQQVFCSQENLYAAVTKYTYSKVSPIINDTAVPKETMIAPMPQYTEETLLYRFALNRGKTEFVTKGNVPGRVLNQFSMDEYDNSLRIVTTKGDVWAQGENISKNNLYVLDLNLKMIGKIEGIAPGEQVYSARFTGNRAYMVTYRTVDPLFVIDLKDKTKPKILGALKIPGYSNYLHPYDENHVIGFGKDTVEVVHKDENGKETGRSAYYLGMKVAMFDITDVTKPKELFVENIGDRGTDSPLLYDHKALLFSKEKNLLAFPVTLMEITDNTQTYGDMPAYGTFAYQGAYVYNVDLKNGFQLKTRISHIDKDSYDKAGMYWYSDGSDVKRILYIGNNLYTVSDNMLKATSLSDFKEIKKLDIK